MKTKKNVTSTCLAIICGIVLMNTNLQAAPCTIAPALLVGGNILTITSVTGTPFCVSATKSAQTVVTYKATLDGGSGFGAGNTLTVQIALGGNWANAITIAKVATTALTGTITATIPAGTPAGATYIMRIVGSNPATAIGGYVPQLTVTNNCAQTTKSEVSETSAVADLKTTDVWSVYPNPSNSTITVAYKVNTDNAKSNINIYNTSGALVASVSDENLTAGQHSRVLNLQDYHLSAGTYLLMLVSDGKTQTTKLIVP